METLVTMVTAILVRMFGRQLEEFGDRITNKMEPRRKQTQCHEPGLQASRGGQNDVNLKP